MKDGEKGIRAVIKAADAVMRKQRVQFDGSSLVPAKEMDALFTALSRLRAPVLNSPAIVDREGLISLIESAMWSPASGPVQWDETKIAAAKSQAASLADSIIAMLSALPAPLTGEG